jgi:hypothetical protein
VSDPKERAKEGAGVSCVRDTSGCHIEDIGILIQRRACEIYEVRGKEPGHEEEDWFRAEREIKHHLGLGLQ